MVNMIRARLKEKTFNDGEFLFREFDEAHCVFMVGAWGCEGSYPHTCRMLTYYENCPDPLSRLLTRIRVLCQPELARQITNYKTWVTHDHALELAPHLRLGLRFSSCTL